MKKILYSLSLLSILILGSTKINAQTSNEPGSGNCLSFDGVDDYVTINDAPNFTFGNTITIEAWISTPIATPASPKTIVAKADVPPYSDLEFNFNLETDGRIRFWISTNGIDNALIVAFSAGSITSNQWYHIAGRYDGSNLTVFLNGIPGANVPRSGNIYNGVAPIEFARAFGTGGSWVFNGKIDEVRIWNTARTNTQIKENMCRKFSDCADPNLVGYWRLDEGTDNTCSGGQDVCDASCNGNNGTKF